MSGRGDLQRRTGSPGEKLFHKALAGFVNTPADGMNIDQDISSVIADNRSFAGAGVINGLNFKDLRSETSGNDGGRA